MTAQMISILWRRSRVKSFESLRSVSKLLNTRILDSTKLACCSFCWCGRMLQLGQGLFIAILRKDAWASVTISLGWLYLINKTDKAEINDLADRSLQGQQKKYPVEQSTPKTRARFTQSLARVLDLFTRTLILSILILLKNVHVASRKAVPYVFRHNNTQLADKCRTKIGR